MKHPNRWDLPKGHLDYGETKQQAALRELQEETGIDAAQVLVVPEFEFHQRYWVSYRNDGGVRKLKELTLFLGLLQEKVSIQVTEHSGFEWLDWNPPHQIQVETIDPLLQSVNAFFCSKKGFWTD